MRNESKTTLPASQVGVFIFLKRNVLFKEASHDAEENMYPIKEVEQCIAHGKDKLVKQMENLVLDRPALQEYAVTQLFNSYMWPGYLAVMRDRVMNPVLKLALQDNVACEIGDLTRISHVTLCRNFVASLNLDPAHEFSKGMPKSGRQAFTLTARTMNMNECEIAGWSLTTETLSPERYRLILPQYKRLGYADTEFLEIHIVVDAEEHAVRLREAVMSILEEKPESILEVLAGVNYATQRALSFLPIMHPMARSASTLQLAAAI